MKQFNHKSLSQSTLAVTLLCSTLFFSAWHMDAQKLQGLLSSGVDDQEVTNLTDEADVAVSVNQEVDAVAKTPAPVNSQKADPKAAQQKPAMQSSATATTKDERSSLKEKIQQEQKPASLQPQNAQKKPGSKIEPPKSLVPDTVPTIEFHFENTDLAVLLSQIEEIFRVKFITDEALNPLSATGKAIKGNKISFKTQEALTRKQAWNVFLNFLDLANLSIVPTADPKFYKILGIDAAYKSAIPSYIGVDPSLLPDNDEVIRYIYFLENTSIDAIKTIVEALRNQTAPVPPVFLQDSKAFILTDKAYNIKMLMQIIKELDKASMPQTLSVLKLRRVDAVKAKALYEQLSRTEDQNMAARLFPARKQPTALYFPENARVFAEPRTNTLILLGPKDATLKIEEFITRYVDVDLDKPYSPLYVYALKYADATTVASILTEVLQFGKNTEAGKHGGVRGEDKYFKSMSFTPDKEANRVIIRGEYEDYLKAVEIIAKLDEPQPQIGIEVLLISVNINDARQLGTQLRSKAGNDDGLLGGNVKFQTSGLAPNGAPQGIVTNPDGPGAQRLLGNLIKLAANANPGNTIISLGNDIYGVWGIFQALETLASAKLVANPFLTTINNYPAKVEVGQIRRVSTGTVVGGNTEQDSKGDYPASLTVNITPQINSDGMIVLDVIVDLTQFLDADPVSARNSQQKVSTKTIVADREVLALGGLIQSTVTDFTSKVPILGDIPILGWLFKNKNKTEVKNSLLILITAKIIKPEETAGISPFTQGRIQKYRADLNALQDPAMKHDPITKLFFKNGEQSTEKIMNNFIFDRHQNQQGPGVKTEQEIVSENKRRKRKRQRLAKNKKSDAATGIVT